jgi:hypothetical protein
MQGVITTLQSNIGTQRCGERWRELKRERWRVQERGGEFKRVQESSRVQEREVEREIM